MMLHQAPRAFGLEGLSFGAVCFLLPGPTDRHHLLRDGVRVHGLAEVGADLAACLSVRPPQVTMTDILSRAATGLGAVRLLPRRSWRRRLRSCCPGVRDQTLGIAGYKRGQARIDSSEKGEPG